MEAFSIAMLALIIGFLALALEAYEFWLLRRTLRELLDPVRLAALMYDVIRRSITDMGAGAKGAAMTAIPWLHAIPRKWRGLAEIIAPHLPVGENAPQNALPGVPGWDKPPPRP